MTNHETNVKKMRLLLRQQHEAKFKIYKDLKLVLQNAENYSITSSEEINETIESLSQCIKNNAEGLKRAMNELEALTQRQDEIMDQQLSSDKRKDTNVVQTE